MREVSGSRAGRAERVSGGHAGGRRRFMAVMTGLTLFVVVMVGEGVPGLAAETPAAEGSIGLDGAVRADRPAAMLPDTIMTRADSVRARILNRVRTTNGTVGADATAAPADTARRPTAGLQGPATAVPRTGAGQAPGGTRAGLGPQLPSGADSIMRALAELPGYEAVTYSGTRAEFSASDRRLILTGSEERRAQFSGRGTRAEADSSIVYDELSGRIRTTGQTVYTPVGGEPVRSSGTVYDVPSGWATAADTETTYTEGQGNWIVQSRQITARQDLMYGRTNRFTSCDHDPPHSYFEADEIKIVADRLLVARSVRLYFDNVPVAWLPFIAQPMTSGRASGILTPGFSVNDIVRTSAGRDRRVSNIGYYWAMSDYSDATLAMDWWSNNYTALTGSVRYRWARQFLDGNLSMRRFWRDTGARDFAVSTRNRWEASERTRLSLSGRYVTNTGLVRQNSLDPRELTSSIDSDAGLQHRFDWGNLSVSARRQQFLSDDRLEMRLPNAQLSMNTLTLFSAAPQQARWYNNMSLSGSTSFSRDVRQFPVQTDTIFRFNQADNTRTQANARASLGLGNLNLSTRVNYRETLFPEVPFAALQPPDNGALAMAGMGYDSFGQNRSAYPLGFPALGLQPDGFTSFSDAEADWNVSVGYQQRLMGTSTITPTISLSGNLARVDTIPNATEFVNAPTRVNLGVNARTEIFGFYPGFAGFEAVRHKVTPGIDYSYSPATQSTDLQRRVFGSRDLRVRNQVTFSMNQTFEARVEERAVEPEPSPAAAPLEDTAEALPTDPDPDDPDVTPLLTEDIDSPDELEAREARDVSDDDGPRRAPQSRVVTLLGLNTSAIGYDIVQADSTGRFIDGFTTTRITNTVRSDYLRGLNLSFAHSLFEEPTPVRQFRLEPLHTEGRRFSPHLEQVSLSFSLDHRSGLVRRIAGLIGVDPSGPSPEEGRTAPEGPVGFDDDPEGFDRSDGFDENQVIPGGSAGPREAGPRRQGWNARLSYSLRRPRETPGAAPTTGALRNQMLSAAISFQPTANWDATWQTNYDLEESRFNDHVLQLRRDLHEWEAAFGFRQTANGNWSFQFDVSLRANRDLRFDYEQRNIDGRDGALGGEGFR